MPQNAMNGAWLKKLATHFEKIRKRHPNDKLMIIFDIDGTILDMRYMVHHVLREYDRVHRTAYFHHLRVSDITVHENHIEDLIANQGVEPEHQHQILEWYHVHRWKPEAILKAHRPFSGVLEVIRWFQIQPNVYVGLNAGRPESIREATLRSLNHLGGSYRVGFSNELLYMNPNDWEVNVAGSKTNGIRYFQEKGYRIFGVVDNEPGNLEAITANGSDTEGILLLHADTIFETKRTHLPTTSVAGDSYDITDLIPEKMLPRNIQFVWHGINDVINLRQFLGSDISWGECDIRLDPITEDLILHHDPLSAEVPEGHEWLKLDTLLNRLMQSSKSVKLDLKQGGIVVDKILDLVDQCGFTDHQLWFNGNIERIQEAGFRRLKDAYPNAIMQCPIDFLEPLICSMPKKTKEILDEFRNWGINRFSISWKNSERRTFFDQMDKWGFDVNVYDIVDLETFLQAVLLLPRSVTCDFNFPKWYYYGRGSGHNGEYYEYSMHKSHYRDNSETLFDLTIPSPKMRD